jgi:DNA-binding GntR family transcriptional regulator
MRLGGPLEPKLALRISENLTQRAYRAVRDEIIKGKLNGRQHLTEGFFAKRFGISKSPIREALNRLEAEGLVTIRPRRGALVSQFSDHDSVEILELREVLEALAIRNADLNPKMLARMRESVRAAQDCLRRNDMAHYILEDAAFHTTLGKMSSNRRLRKILENMHNQMLILRRMTSALTSHIAVKQHHKILQALEKGRKDVAENLMVQHIRTVRKRLIEHLKEQAAHQPPTSGDESAAGEKGPRLRHRNPGPLPRKSAGLED